MAQLSCFHDAVASVAYSPSPSAEHELYAAAGEEVFCFDLRLLSVNAEGGGQLALIATLKASSEEVNSIAVNPKGRYLAACDDAGELQVYDLHAMKKGSGPPTVFKALRGGHTNICAALTFVGWRPWEIVRCVPANALP